jgi:hypothetical protein
LAVREIKRVRSLIGKDLTDDALSEALEGFYNSHQALIESNLAISEERAKRFCWGHALELVDAIKLGATEDLFLRWQTEDATQLAQEVLL